MLQSFAEGKAIVQIVLPLSWVPRINKLAVDRGVNRSALIRGAIEQAFFCDQASEIDQPAKENLLYRESAS
jgi:hypothetical protein